MRYDLQPEIPRGLDKYGRISVIRKRFEEAYNECRRHPELLPEWLVDHMELECYCRWERLREAARG
jgi:hypothetical protein